jgi:type IV secretion system protein VirD4
MLTSTDLRDGLLLGYEMDAPARPMGFGGAAETVQGPRPIWHGREGHLLAVAPSGAGKSTGYVLPTAALYPGNCLFLDPKGELCRASAARRRAMGHTVLRIDPYGIADTGPDGAVEASLNPLDLLDLRSFNLLDDAMVLASNLVASDGLRDPHWEIRAREFLAGMIVMCKLMPGELSTLYGLRLMLSQDTDGLGAVLAAMRTSPEHRDFLRASANGLLAIPDKERGSILSTMSRDLFFALAPGMRRAAGPSTFRLSDFAETENLTLYLCIPPDRLATLAPFIRLWVSCLIKVLIQRKTTPKHRTLLVLDELGQLGRMDLLVNLITLIRGYHVDVFGLVQDLGQLKALYPAEWRTIANNCSGVLAFGFRNAAIAEAASELTGYAGERSLLGMDDHTVVLTQPGKLARLVRRPSSFEDPVLRGLLNERPVRRAVRDDGGR